jgi:alpha-L-fucosidase
VRNLIACARDGGNYLLNIGPKGDGSIPEESVRILTDVGSWMDRNGETIYMSDPCQPRRSAYASFTRKGTTLYMHVYFWPGEEVSIAGLQVPVRRARLQASGQVLNVQQDKLRVRLTGLPSKAPDQPVTTIALECDGEPRQDTNAVRTDHERPSV